MENQAKKTTLKTLLIVFLACLTFVFIIAWNNKISSEVILKYVVESFMHALVVVFILGILLEYFVREEHEETIIYRLRDELFGPKSFEKLFKREKISDITHQAMVALTDPIRGEALFLGNVRPYIEKDKFNYRTEYEYNIRIVDGVQTKSESAEAVFPRADYYSIIQSISYATHFGTKNIGLKKDEVKVAFVYSHSTHASIVQNNKFIFREVLSINSKQIEILENMNGEELEILVSSYMQPQLFSSANALAEKLRIERIDGGFAVVFDASELWIDSVQDVMQFKFEFNIPYSKAAKHFLVLFPEPTKQPTVTFQPALGQQIEAIPFFTRDESNINPMLERTAHIGMIKYKLSTWLFPSSGIVFVWQ